MYKIILNIGISLIAGAIGSYGVINIPFSFWEKFNKPLLGDVSLTTIVGSNTLSNFPAVYNANNALLNSGKIDVSSTTINAITTLTNLSTVGTITSGTWQGTGIDVARQGTGSTSPSLNYVMLGNGTSGFKVVTGLGSSGQFLTSNGAGSPPNWTSGAVDTGINYSWSGLHYFQKASSTQFSVGTLFASSTSANPLVFNGLSYIMPSARSASSTVLSENGSGSLTFNTVGSLGAGYFIAGTTTDTTHANSATEKQVATFSTPIPGGLMGNNGAIELELFVTRSESAGNNTGTISFKLGGVEACGITTGTFPTSAGASIVKFTFFNTGSSSTNSCVSSMVGSGGSVGSAGVISEGVGLTVNTAINQTVTVTYSTSESDQTFTVNSATLKFLGRQ